MNVLFLAAEMAPYASTGGLGEVIASLPDALQRLEINCRVLIPAYSQLDLPRTNLQQWEISFDHQPLAITLQRASDNIYLLDIPRYFQREQLYGYEDDVLRFGAFCRAALLAQKYFADQSWPVDVIHCHDWHSALYPVYKSTFDAPGKVLLTIHNLAYQGVCDLANLQRLGLPSSLADWRKLEFWGQLNPFKGGLVFADAISTVSPTYAKEIQTAEYGCGLEGVLQERSSRVFGIINGIDRAVWNPLKDANLIARYSAEDPAGKQQCKKHLQQMSDLNQDAHVPLVGMVTRLTAQKGIDLLLDAIDDVMNLGIQFVALGDGEPALQAALQEAAKRYPGRMSITAGIFDAALAHRIYAGSDFFLMPSRFEPCGLAQMISMRYGTIPIVRATGGLADTVRNFEVPNNGGNGFSFETPDAPNLLQTLRRGVAYYHQPAWKILQQNAFCTDFSWDHSALEYKKLYSDLVRVKELGEAPFSTSFTA